MAEALGTDFLARAAAVAQEVALRVTAADRVQAVRLLPKELWRLQGPQRQWGAWVATGG